MFNSKTDYTKRASDLAEIFTLEDAALKKEKLKAFIAAEKKLADPGKAKTLPLFVLAQTELDELHLAEVPFADIGFSLSTQGGR